MTAAGPCFVSTHAYPLDLMRGHVALASLLGQSPDPIAGVYPDFNLQQIDSFVDGMFLDTETTGLGTGAGIYAFMIGLGTFETVPLQQHTEPSPVTKSTGAQERSAPTHFVVRQLFMRSPAEELALFHEFVAQLNRKRLVITFNGRSFDLPLLRSRLRFHRRDLGDTLSDAALLHPQAPHIDLLLPARRLWRRRLQSCRLVHLEQAILEHERSEADVPGYLIPQLYAEFVRHGDASEMERVFYHNREDILSMVSLSTHLTRAFDRSQHHRHGSVVQGQDWLSLAMTYERMQDWAQAEPAYRRALEAAQGRSEQAEVFARLAGLQKRQGRWHEAAETWQLWLTTVPGNDPAPYVELSKYYEWRVHDYEQAEMWAAWALHNLQQDGSEFAWTRTIGELEHRLQRIRRKRNS